MLGRGDNSTYPPVVSTSSPGLVPKLWGDGTKYFSDDGTMKFPSTGVSTVGGLYYIARGTSSPSDWGTGF